MYLWAEVCIKIYGVIIDPNVTMYYVRVAKKMHDGTVHGDGVRHVSVNLTMYYFMDATIIHDGIC